MRRYGAPVRRDRTYRPRPGVYAILLRGNRVLLTHQSTPRPEFQLPGGGVWQLFFHDPNGARVELDFDGSESR